MRPACVDVNGGVSGSTEGTSAHLFFPSLEPHSKSSIQMHEEDLYICKEYWYRCKTWIYVVAFRKRTSIWSDQLMFFGGAGGYLQTKEGQLDDLLKGSSASQSQDKTTYISWLCKLSVCLPATHLIFTWLIHCFSSLFFYFFLSYRHLGFTKYEVETGNGLFKFSEDGPISGPDWAVAV